MLEATERTLRAMSASAFATIVADFRAIVSDPARQAVVLTWFDREEIDPEVDGLDGRFFSLGSDALAAAHRDWLIASPGVAVCADHDALLSQVSAFKASAAAVARREVVAAARRLVDPNNRWVRIARALCGAAGLTFCHAEQVRNSMAWIFEVGASEGIFSMHVLEDRASLFPQGWLAAPVDSRTAAIATVALIDRKLPH